jgi:hypothetical protein
VTINSGHHDFPALLAEALDAVAAAEMDAKLAAEWLKCTPSQLIKFLQKEPRAIELVNQQRRIRGQPIYR